MFGWKLIKEKEYEELCSLWNKEGIVCRLSHLINCSRYPNVVRSLRNYCFYNIGNESMMDQAIDKEIKERSDV